MPNESRGRLDHAIDHAVRGMMQVDPAPGLRHRVADRLAATRRRPWMLAAMATATVAVVVVLAVTLFRPPERAVEPDVALTSAPSAAPAIPAPAAVRPRAATARRAHPARARDATAAVPRRDDDVIFGAARDHVSAANVRPATASDLSDAGSPSAEVPDDFFLLPPIAVTPISIPPIVIPPVTVRPLSVRK